MFLQNYEDTSLLTSGYFVSVEKSTVCLTVASFNICPPDPKFLRFMFVFGFQQFYFDVQCVCMFYPSWGTQSLLNL